jgi:type III pantothenate kinase
VKRLLIDAGNTNIKLACVDDEHWLASDSVPTRQADTLNLSCYSDVQEVWVSNVAGAQVARQLVDACFPLLPRFVGAQDTQCGVTNSYAIPAQLGSDRWAALIAAWQHVRGACLVVNSGTASTIDALSNSGEFLGGLILPGIELMRNSLGGAAANLQSGGGSYADFPRNTKDAMQSGALQATCGAIARQYQLLGVADAPVLLGGGAAPVLLAHLGLPVQRAGNLVLQGLLLIANETGGA